MLEKTSLGLIQRRANCKLQCRIFGVNGEFLYAFIDTADRVNPFPCCNAISIAPKLTSINTRTKTQSR